jgi:hypothetical protein
MTRGGDLGRVSVHPKRERLTVQEEAMVPIVIDMHPEIPSPEPVPPVNNPDPQPGDPKPKAPPSDDEPGRRSVPVELPGRPGVPERARGRQFASHA